MDSIVTQKLLVLINPCTKWFVMYKLVSNITEKKKVCWAKHKHPNAYMSSYERTKNPVQAARKHSSLRSSHNMRHFPTTTPKLSMALIYKVVPVFLGHDSITLDITGWLYFDFRSNKIFEFNSHTKTHTHARTHTTTDTSAQASG